MSKPHRHQHTARSMLITVCLSVAGTVAAMAPLAAAAAPRYAVTEITSGIGGDQYYAIDLNNAGAMTGSFYTGVGYETQAFLYKNGITSNIGPVGSRGWRMNNAGDVVGTVNGTAALFKNGTVQYLEQSDGVTSYATAINDKGQIVGTKSSGADQRIAFLYENGVMTDLNVPRSNYTFGQGINNAGQIILDSSLGAYLYQNGSYTKMESPFGPDYHTRAVGINDHGVVIGGYGDWSMTGVGSVYENGRMRSLGRLPDRWDTAPSDINNAGQIVGHAHDDGYDPLAFIYENNVLTDLNTLIDPTDGYRLAYADAINDVGQILALRCDPDRFLPCQQVLLDPIGNQNPVPEPGSTSMLLAGLTLVGFYQRRRAGKRTGQTA